MPGSGRRRAGDRPRHALRYGNPRPQIAERERLEAARMMEMAKKYTTNANVATSSSSATAASVPALSDGVSAPVQLTFRAHIIDSSANVAALVGTSKSGQYLDLKAFKALQFQGPTEVIERFNKGLAYLAPEKIAITAFSSTSLTSNLALELPSVKAKHAETANAHTGNLAVLLPLFKRIQSNGMLESPGVLYDRPHDEALAAFLQDFGADLAIPGELEKTYCTRKDGRTEVDLDSVLHTHYTRNAGETFQFETAPHEDPKLGAIFFQTADFDRLKSNLVDTFSTRAAVFNKDTFALRLSALESTDATGRLQAGRFVDPKSTDTFEVVLEGTMDTRVMVQD